MCDVGVVCVFACDCVCGYACLCVFVFCDIYIYDVRLYGCTWVLLV